MLELEDGNQEKFDSLLFSRFLNLYDTNSRSTVRDLLLMIVQNEVNLNMFAHFSFETATSNSFLAVTSLMTILEWVNMVILQLSMVSSFSDNLQILIHSQGLLLWKILEIPGADRKGRQMSSALRSTRTSVVKSLSHTNPNSIEFCKFCLEIMLEKLAGPSKVLSLALLAEASIDLLPSNPGIQHYVELKKSDIYMAYANNILKSLCTFPMSLVTSFDPIFMEFMTEDDFNTILAPAVSKAIMTSPEVVLDSIVPSFFKCLSISIDPSFALDSCLLNPLLLQFECLDSQRRRYSLLSLKYLLVKVRKNAAKSEEVIHKMVLQLKTAQHPEYIGEALGFVTPNETVSPVICTHLSKFLIKEAPNFTSDYMIHAYIRHVTFLLQSNTILDPLFTDVICDGVSGKFKQPYTTALVHFVMEEGVISHNLRGISEQVFAEILEYWKTIIDNPDLVAHMQNKNLSIGFAIICLAHRLGLDRDIEFFIKVFSINLFSSCSTLTEEQDLTWAIRSLEASTDTVLKLDDDIISSEWALAWVHYVIAAPTPTSLQLARSRLAELYVKNQFLGQLFFKCLFQSLVLKTKEKMPVNRLSNFIITLFSRVDKAISRERLENDLSAIIVLVHHNECAVKRGWVGLCQRLGVDSKKIAIERGTFMFNDILTIANLATKSEDTQLLQASFSALNTLVSLNCSLITLLEEVLGQSISASLPQTGDKVLLPLKILERQLSVHCSDSECMASSCPLKSKNAFIIKGKIIYSSQALLFFGFISVFSNLADIVPGILQRWYLAVVQLSSRFFVKRSTPWESFGAELGSISFLRLFNLVSTQLNPIQEILGVVALRALNFTVKPMFEKVSLDEQILQVLLSINSADGRQLDMVTVNYARPLIFHIIQHLTTSGDPGVISDDVKALSLVVFPGSLKESDQTRSLNFEP